MRLPVPNFFSPTWSAGVSVGSERIVIMCLVKKGDGYQLAAYAKFRPNEEQAINEAISNLNSRGAQIKVGIEDWGVKIRRLSVPEVPKNELAQVIQWALKDSAKVDLEDYTVRYYRIGKGLEEKTESYVAFALENAQLQTYNSQLKTLGLAKTKVIEPYIQALTNNVIFNYQPKGIERYAIIDFDQKQTPFAVVSAEGLEFYRPLAGVSGEILISQIGRDLGIELEGTEKYLRALSKDIPIEKNSKLLDTIVYFLSKLSIEITHSLESYEKQFPNEPIVKILLSGGAAYLEVLRNHIKGNTSIPVELLEPLKKISTAGFSIDSLEDLKIHCGVALGLAL